MEVLIQKYNIDCVWHFTDKSNLDSIREHGGLLSLEELERRGISIPAPGGNDLSHELDSHNGVDSFVHLCFCKSHPMLHIAKEDGRISDPEWLKIDKSIILHPEVRFTADVSNKSGIPVLDHEAAKREIDFEVIYKRTNWSDPDTQKRRQKGEKSEILVPNIVPIDMILNI